MKQPKALSRTARSRRRRGVGFLWFSLIGIPCFFFSAAISVDVTRIYVANRQARTAAEASAVAGAFEFKSTGTGLGNGELDPAKARAIATETFAANENANAIRFADVESISIDASTSSVTVTVSYRPEGLVFLDWVAGSQGDVYEVSQTADVCVPGEYGPTGGLCTRPR